MLNERSIFPLSTRNEDIAYSLPVLVGKEGIIQRLDISIDNQEAQDLTTAKQFIRNTIEQHYN